MKRLTYEDLWRIAFVENECFNEKYLNTYIKRNKEYQECSLIITEDNLPEGLPFRINGVRFILTCYDYNNDNYKIIKKYRVDSWSKILKMVEKYKTKKGENKNEQENTNK